MKYITIADTDLSVSELCFGCWGIVSDFHWGDRDADASVATMNAALDAGINFFDTATVYGNGASEELVGKFFCENGKRRDVVIASKVPPNRMRPEEIVAECEASLQRLQTDYLDLYQTHWPDHSARYEDVLDALTMLIKQGKIRAAGCSNETCWGVMKSLWAADTHNVDRYQTVQNNFSLINRRFEDGLAEVCRRIFFQHFWLALCYLEIPVHLSLWNRHPGPIDLLYYV